MFSTGAKYLSGLALHTRMMSNLAKKRSHAQSLADRVVMITGATAGIGSACAWRFAEGGSRLILVGRRGDRLEALKSELLLEFPQLKVHCEAMSVTDLPAVAALPYKLPVDFQSVEVLVNNAGLALGVNPVYENSVDDAVTVMETNVTGLIAMTTAFVTGMKARGAGHIINMGSIAGHTPYQNGTIYNASKFAVNGFTNASRFDLMHTPLRVTHISPGLVGNTEFSNVRLGNDTAAAAVYADVVALSPEDVADNVYYAATRPPHVQISEITMYATNQGGPRDVVRAGPDFGGPQP
jgi:3-hydroxy acid dehydrogenase / malonic semialdehyde reductase